MVEGRINLTSERGYLLVSTLFFLIFSGIFAHSIIKISGNQIIQYNQMTSSYQAKASLNMGKEILRQEIEENSQVEKGLIKTSTGNIDILRKDSLDGTIYSLTLTTSSGYVYSDNLFIKQAETEMDSLDTDLEETIENTNDKTSNEPTE